MLYLQSAKTQEHPRPPKPFPRTRNSKNTESEVHTKSDKTIDTSPKGTSSLLGFIYYCTFQLILNLLKSQSFIFSVKFTIRRKLC